MYMCMLECISYLLTPRSRYCSFPQISRIILTRFELDRVFSLPMMRTSSPAHYCIRRIQLSPVRFRKDVLTIEHPLKCMLL